MGGYGEDLATIHAEGYGAVARGAADVVLGALAPRSRVLELGCGDGTTAALLAAAGHSVRGIDSSAAMIELARRRVPEAQFEVGSFLDAPLGGPYDAMLAVGEVLGYALDPRVSHGSLEPVLARCSDVLREGGLLAFDVGGPSQAVARSWNEGEGWAVLVDGDADGATLTRRIVAFRAGSDGRFRRTEEVHRLVLHRPSEVLALLRRLGFAARSLGGSYAGAQLPRGVTAYLARKR